eukprot:gb/GEZN01006487.1/.p1 GENE.gb/GEZN01006487.1/~~gb/GEZN01006487.1/.p1  ORF type:complete len:435 (+),score=22.10 gb/GEZN01006487.1/:333-1637(+)
MELRAFCLTLPLGAILLALSFYLYHFRFLSTGPRPLPFFELELEMPQQQLIENSSQCNRIFGFEMEFQTNTSQLTNHSSAAVAEALRRAGLSNVWSGPHRLREATDITRAAQGIRIVNELGFGLVKSTPFDVMPAEAVTPKLKGLAGEDVIRKMLLAMSNLNTTISEASHLHVHVDASNLTFPHLRHLSLCFLLHEFLFDSISAWHSRRDRNKFAKSNLFGVRGNWNVTAAIGDVLNSTDQLQLRKLFNRKRQHTSAYPYSKSVLSASIRYYKLTLPDSHHDPTRVSVEWRQHQGSTEPYEVLTWIRLVRGFVEGAEADFASAAPYCRAGLQPSLVSLLRFAGFSRPELGKAFSFYSQTSFVFQDHTVRFLPANRIAPGEFLCHEDTAWREPHSHFHELKRWVSSKKNSQGCLDLDWTLADKLPCNINSCFHAD